MIHGKHVLCHGFRRIVSSHAQMVEQVLFAEIQVILSGTAGIGKGFVVVPVIGRFPVVVQSHERGGLNILMVIDQESAGQCSREPLCFMEFVVGNSVGVGRCVPDGIVTPQVDPFRILIKVAGIG